MGIPCCTELVEDHQGANGYKSLWPQGFKFSKQF
jgi:hypothetical protein